MILRVWDYYKDFKCIADKCKDSCCIGWEIDIDEDTYEYYRSVDGPFGKRLQQHMYLTEDKEHSFSLQEHGRCPFLNSTNLCDICIELGEEALSEVCTEYPRFAIEYGNVLQKALCLSCEEVGRILFTHEAAVTLVDYEMGEEAEEEDEISKEDWEFISFMEQLQVLLINVLQNRKNPLVQRIAIFLAMAKKAQALLNEEKNNFEYALLEIKEIANQEQEAVEDLDAALWRTISYEDFWNRFYIFDQMEVLGEEWSQYKSVMREVCLETNYEERVTEYWKHSSYKETDYEQLVVYFLFRYFMNAVYNYDVYSYAVLAVTFTRVIFDMDVVRFWKNGKNFSLEDRIDTVRIFCKEVEHSEDNVELAREEILF